MPKVCGGGTRGVVFPIYHSPLCHSQTPSLTFQISGLKKTWKFIFSSPQLTTGPTGQKPNQVALIWFVPKCFQSWLPFSLFLGHLTYKTHAVHSTSKPCSKVLLRGQEVVAKLFSKQSVPRVLFCSFLKIYCSWFDLTGVMCLVSASPERQRWNPLFVFKEVSFVYTNEAFGDSKGPWYLVTRNTQIQGV